MMKMFAVGELLSLTDNLRIADHDILNGYFEFERVKKMPDGDFSWVGVAQGLVVAVISAPLEDLLPT